MKNENDVISFSANKKWLSIPEETRRMLEKNVWCNTCSEVVTIGKFIVEDSPAGIVLRGNCKKCGNKVARVID